MKNQQSTSQPQKDQTQHQEYLDHLHILQEIEKFKKQKGISANDNFTASASILPNPSQPQTPPPPTTQ